MYIVLCIHILTFYNFSAKITVFETTECSIQRLMVALDDLKGPFQPKRLHDSMIPNH